MVMTPMADGIPDVIETHMVWCGRFESVSGTVFVKVNREYMASSFNLWKLSIREYSSGL
jgi:hypothetical protein